MRCRSLSTNTDDRLSLIHLVRFKAVEASPRVAMVPTRRDRAAGHGSRLDVATDDIENQIDGADVFQGSPARGPGRLAPGESRRMDLDDHVVRRRFRFRTRRRLFPRPDPSRQSPSSGTPLSAPGPDCLVGRHCRWRRLAAFYECWTRYRTRPMTSEQRRRRWPRQRACHRYRSSRHGSPYR